MVALKPTQQLRKQPQKRGGRGCPELQAGRQQGVPAALLHTLPAPEEKEIFLKQLISLFFFFFCLHSQAATVEGVRKDVVGLISPGAGTRSLL